MSNGFYNIPEPKNENIYTYAPGSPEREHLRAELERQYSIKIVLDEVSPEILFTGGFIHNNMDNALKSVTQPLNLK